MLSFAQVVETGRLADDDAARSRFDETRAKAKAEDVATLVYTSGTTGNPKGAMLTHGNIASNVLATCKVLPIENGMTGLSILPLSHILERMGDYASGIARICIDIGDQPHIKPLIDIPRMAEKSVSMLRRSLDAFIERDVAAAESIAREDDEVDDLYQQVYRELLTIMLANPRTIDQATRLLWAAHNLERVADRVQNICERVVFVVTGRMQELSRGSMG